MSIDIQVFIEMMQEQSEMGAYILQYTGIPGMGRSETIEEFRRQWNRYFRRRGYQPDKWPNEVWQELRRAHVFLVPPIVTDEDISRKVSALADLAIKLLKSLNFSFIDGAPLLLAWYIRKKKEESIHEDSTLHSPRVRLDISDESAIRAILTSILDQRTNDLKSHITENLSLLKQLEDRRRTSSDPIEKDRLDQDIEARKAWIDSFIKELKQLSESSYDDIPKDILAEMLLNRAKSDNPAFENTTFLRPVDENVEYDTVYICVLPGGRAIPFLRNTDPIALPSFPAKLFVVLETGTTDDQVAAAHALSTYGPMPSTIRLLRRFMIDGHPRIRATAADILAEFNPTELFDEFVVALADEDRVVRSIVATAIADSHNQTAKARLIQDFLVLDLDAASASIVIRRMADELVPQIITRYSYLSEDQKSQVCQRVLQNLDCIFEILVKHLFATGDDCVPDSAWEICENVVCEALERGLTTSVQMRALVLRGLQHPSWQVRYSAIHVAKELKSEDAVEILAKALKHRDINTRPFAAYWLSRLHGNHARAKKLLVEAYLKEKDHDVKRAIGHLLGRDCPKTKLQQLVEKITLLFTVIYFFAVIIVAIIRTTATTGYFQSHGGLITTVTAVLFVICALAWVWTLRHIFWDIVHPKIEAQEFWKLKEVKKNGKKRRHRR